MAVVENDKNAYLWINVSFKKYMLQMNILNEQMIFNNCSWITLTFKQH